MPFWRRAAWRSLPRRNSTLKIGIDLPTPDAIRAIIAHLKGR
jgi:hypothetical protein